MLRNYLALVTGSESGIGRGIASEFIEQEATVIGIDIADQGATKKLGDRYVFRQCDVSDIKQIEGVCGFITEKFGKLDILVNNAGGGRHSPIEGITEEMWNRQFGVLVKGPLFLVQSLTPLLRKSDNASIVNIVSCSSERVDATHYLYDVPKAAVKHFTNHLVAALPGIRANSILPGFIESNAYKRDSWTPEFKKMVFEYSLGATIPMGRIGQPRDVAKLVAFLCSEDATYINGAHIAIDGGWTQCCHLQVKTKWDGKSYVDPNPSE